MKTFLATQNAPQWLKAGDEVSVEIEGLGRLTNRLIAPPVGLRQVANAMAIEFRSGRLLTSPSVSQIRVSNQQPLASL